MAAVVLGPRVKETLAEAGQAPAAAVAAEPMRLAATALEITAEPVEQAQQAASRVQASHAAAAVGVVVPVLEEAEAQAAVETAPPVRDHLPLARLTLAVVVVLNIWQPTLRLAAPAS